MLMFFNTKIAKIKSGRYERWYSSVASLRIAPRPTPTYIFIFNLEMKLILIQNRNTVNGIFWEWDF